MAWTIESVRVIFTAIIIGGELSREIDGTTNEARWFTRDSGCCDWVPDEWPPGHTRAR